jgi:hypothetical protein
VRRGPGWAALDSQTAPKASWRERLRGQAGGVGGVALGGWPHWTREPRLRRRGRVVCVVRLARGAGSRCGARRVGGAFEASCSARVPERRSCWCSARGVGRRFCVCACAWVGGYGSLPLASPKASGPRAPGRFDGGVCVARAVVERDHFGCRWYLCCCEERPFIGQCRVLLRVMVKNSATDHVRCFVPGRNREKEVLSSPSAACCCV